MLHWPYACSVCTRHVHHVVLTKWHPVIGCWRECSRWGRLLCATHEGHESSTGETRNYPARQRIIIAIFESLQIVTIVNIQWMWITPQLWILLCFTWHGKPSATSPVRNKYKEAIVVTSTDNIICNKLLQGTIDGKRRRGRVRKMWPDNIKSWTRRPPWLNSGQNEGLRLKHPFVHSDDWLCQGVWRRRRWMLSEMPLQLSMTLYLVTFLLRLIGADV